MDLGWSSTDASWSNDQSDCHTCKVGQYYLLHLLQPAMMQVVQSKDHDTKSVRVILVSSSGASSSDKHFSDEKLKFGQRELSFLDETPSITSALKANGIMVALFHLGNLQSDPSESWLIPFYSSVFLHVLCFQLATSLLFRGQF